MFLLGLFSCDDSQSVKITNSKKQTNVWACSICKKIWHSENYPKVKQNCPLGHSIKWVGRFGNKRHKCSRCGMTLYLSGKPFNGPRDCWILNGGRAKHSFNQPSKKTNDIRKKNRSNSQENEWIGN